MYFSTHNTSVLKPMFTNSVPKHYVHKLSIFQFFALKKNPKKCKYCMKD